MYSLIETAKLNGAQPLAYLSDLLRRLPVTRKVDDLEALLPWNWKAPQPPDTLAALADATTHTPEI